MLKEQNLQFDLRVSQSCGDVIPDKCWHFYSERHMRHIFDIELSVKASVLLHQPCFVIFIFTMLFWLVFHYIDIHATYRKFVGHHFSPAGTSLKSLKTAPDISSFLTDLPWLWVSYWRWSWDYCYNVAVGAVQIRASFI